MRIIKAKYPKIGNEYVGYQGFGALYGYPNVHNITKEIAGERSIEETHESPWPN